MGTMAIKEAFDWVIKDPKSVRASSTVIRISDDMASHKFELERGHSASSVECYMKQDGVLEQPAYLELSKHVEKAWKDINQDLVLFQCFSHRLPILHEREISCTKVARIYSRMLEK
ncbi:hypothetical protein AAG906_015997 [Vitis piasezkii]